MTESKPSQSHVARPDWGVYAVVWGTWAFMLLALLGFVARYSHNGPGRWDELGQGYVPILVGERPLTAEWLWKPIADHRMLVPKLILWVLARLTGGDFRASLFVAAFGLGVLAFMMIRAAASIRGSLKYTDVTFPLVLLNWGHAAGLLQAINTAFPLIALVSGIALVIIARSAPRWRERSGALRHMPSSSSVDRRRGGNFGSGACPLVRGFGYPAVAPSDRSAWPGRTGANAAIRRNGSRYGQPKRSGPVAPGNHADDRCGVGPRTCVCWLRQWQR